MKTTIKDALLYMADALINADELCARGRFRAVGGDKYAISMWELMCLGTYRKVRIDMWAVPGTWLDSYKKGVPHCKLITVDVNVTTREVDIYDLHADDVPDVTKYVNMDKLCDTVWRRRIIDGMIRSAKIAKKRFYSVMFETKKEVANG